MEDEKKISGIVKVEPKPSKGFTSTVIDFLENVVVKLFYDSSLPHHYLAGNFAPVPDETPPTEDLPVRGYLPDCLNGEFVRVGPNPKFAPVAGYHWFDGDGCVILILCTNIFFLQVCKRIFLVNRVAIFDSRTGRMNALFAGSYYCKNHGILMSNIKLQSKY